ncbi:DUF1565 domain-containing protein [Ornithinibacillus scapharcae]|uniref:DUF1565 domain-containing protein n=1 Tax=Ornithinibacillus scapharcae TaxID=1147159 RepID=UPI000225B0C0|nr:right-handed parallel beta-helix repeat-containing protein [Ornithinibacillus scapharcae]
MKKSLIITLIVTAVMIVMVLNYVNSNNDNTIYVAMNGDDQNEGTKSEPFRTLQKAASEAKAGTTVLIREGIYEEPLVVQYSGTKSKPIIFKPYKQEEVVISGSKLTNKEGDTSLITIHDKDYITISGITIQDLTTNLTDETVMGIYVTGSSSHITLENNHVHRIETLADDGNAHGIAIYGTESMKDINIVQNTVEDLKLGSSESIVLNGNIDGFKVDGNLVRRNDNIGIDLIGYEGVANDKKHDFVRNGVIKDNKVYEISSFGNPAYGEEYVAGGIYVDGGKDITIEKNTVYQSDIGIEATSEHANHYAENITIINNVVYQNFYSGISIGGYDQNRGGTKNSLIAENILYRNDTKGLDGGQLLLQHDINNNIIERNIMTAGPSRIFIANYFKTNNDNELIRNIFHAEKGEDGIWVWKETEYTSFPDFRKASNSDEKSSYIEIEYQDEKSLDLKLKRDAKTKDILE